MPDEPIHTQQADAGATARLMRSRDKQRERADKAEAQLAQLQTQLTASTARVETLEKSSTVKRVQELEGQLKQRAYRDKFGELAAAKKIRKDALDDLWELAVAKGQIDMAGEEPDPEPLEALLAAAVKAKPYLVGAAQETVVEPVIPPAPAQGRGPADTNGGAPQFTWEQLNDAEFAWKNNEAITKAALAGTIK